MKEQDTFDALRRMSYGKNLFKAINEERKTVEHNLGQSAWTDDHHKLLDPLVYNRTGWHLSDIEKQISRPAKDKSPEEILFMLYTRRGWGK